MSTPPYADLPDDPDTIFLAILAAGAKGGDLVRLYHQLRCVAPVFQADFPRLQNPWVITRHADDELLVRNGSLIKDDRQLVMSGIGEGGAFIQAMQGMFSFMPPPRHTELRGLVNRGFTPRSVRQLEPHIEGLVARLLEEKREAGGMDLARDFAFRIPMIVICELLGVPLSDIDHIEGWARTFSERADEGDALSAEMEAAGNDAARQFMDFLQSLVDARRVAPRDDLISRLVGLQREAGAALSDADIVSTALLLFQAGHETTANMISKGALALIRHPDQLRRLHDQPELAKNAVEELLRFDTPVQMTTKFAASEIPFHDATIQKDDPVIFFWGAVNRDPNRYPDPDQLDLERGTVDHHSFGMGAHFCLGASLARLELRHAFTALATRLPGLQLAGEPVYKGQLHVHGLSSLPVSW
jgi:pimeloyl-[acyl-carrier protein] synthase